MNVKRLQRVFQMLHFFCDTLARIPLFQLRDVGNTLVSVTSSILNYDTVLLVYQEAGLPTILAEKGLPAGAEALGPALWDTVDVPVLLESGSKPLGELLQRYDLGPVVLASPVRVATERGEERIGLLVATQPRGEWDAAVDLQVLDVLAGLTGGAFLNCQIQRRLLDANYALQCEIERRKGVEAELQSRRKELELANGELQAQNEELEQQSRDLEALNRQSWAAREESRKQAEALALAHRQKDQFLAMLGHELRNPLAAVSNALQVMGLSQPGTEGYRRAREVAVRQVQHQVRMVDDLLDVSRIERGKIELHRERLDWVRLIDETVEAHHPALAALGLELRVALPESPVEVYGDRVRLTQILDNLLDNARKFTPAGGRITLELRTEGTAAMLSIIDTGIGIEPEILPHLFQPFNQADRSLERSRGGLGLGLALIRGLAELHGGHVDAHSEGLGRGATFTLTLPIAGEGVTPQAGPGAARLHSVACRVLVIEDNRDGAETLRDLLELYGCEVEVAYAGPEGLRKAQAFRPEVVLCDIGLPGFSGYQVATELKHQGTRARLIAISGYAGEEDRRRSLEAGFELHLAKPVGPEDLLEALQLPAHQ